MGSSIAYFLKQRSPDLKVTVIERDWNVRLRIQAIDIELIECVFLNLVFDVEYRAVGRWPPSTVRTCKYESRQKYLMGAFVDWFAGGEHSNVDVRC
jgi:hypothetical protein